jgi:hypothetical protein
VSISTVPSAGYGFNHWTTTAGGTLGSAATVNANTITLTSDATVTAVDTANFPFMVYIKNTWLLRTIK